MPFIEEAKYQLMQEDIDATRLKLEETEKELNEVHEDLKHQKQRTKTFIVLLCTFLGVAIGIIYMFASGNLTNEGMVINSHEKIDVAKIKADEAQRVLDSIGNLTTSDTSNSFASSEDVSLEDEVAKIGENSNGQTIYSVQIGVFSNKGYPLLSKSTLAGIAAQNDGFFKYSLGIFATLNEAKTMKNELVKIGFKDAFVASYINGERQQIHH